jgi:hypothetical protein
MKLLGADVIAAAVTTIRDAAHAILAACTAPPDAFVLWQRVLCSGIQELMCCVLAADLEGTFGTTFGEVAWRLLHVQDMACEHFRKHKRVHTAVNGQASVDDGSAMAAHAVATGATSKSSDACMHGTPFGFISIMLCRRLEKKKKIL